MKKILWCFVLVLMINSSVFAQTVYDDNYVENPNYLKGMEYLQNSQYSSAITEFKKAVRTNPKDNSALIGLSNAYNLRAKHYNDTLHDTAKAIIDIKSALFFNKYFRQSNTSNVAQMEKNLKLLETSKKIDLSSDEIEKTAKSERIQGEFAAAGYDYYRLSFSGSHKEEANIALGDIFKIFNRPDKSIVFYQNALAVNPNNAEVHLKIARVYEDMKDFNSSLKEYSYALDKSEESTDVLMSLERIWQKRVDETPDDAEAHANLGVVYQKEKRYNEALSEYKKAEELNPKNTNTKINMAALYQEQKKYDLALNIYDEILKIQPSNKDLLIYKAECLNALNRKEEAIDTYKTILKIDPQNTAVRTDLFALIKDDMPQEDILSFLYQNILNSPKDASAYYEFAYELHKAGKIDDAITYYKQAIKFEPENVEAYINLSQCFRQKQKYTEAIETIKKAKELSPGNKIVQSQFDSISQDYASQLYTSAASAYESGDYEKAIEIYSKIDPKTSESALGIAGSYQSMGNTDKAIEYYNAAMVMSPNNPDIAYYLASIYANNNNLEQADKYTKYALSKNPSHSMAKELAEYIASQKTSALLEEAVKIYEDEKYPEAIALFDKIIAMDASNANIYYYRALSYDAVKDYQKAISDYENVIKLEPNMTIAYYSIAVDYDNLEKYDSAKEYYKKYTNLITEDNEYKDYALSRLKDLEQ